MSKNVEDSVALSHGKVMIGASSSGSRSWIRSQDPRIVRVSQAFGGKDRHSKVCTIKGLRDRRVRLSVPTATQLYDLQDRLGLCQPSKVVDWLLDAAKHEIDKLPPLPMVPLANIIQSIHHPRSSVASGGSTSNGHIQDYPLGSSSDEPKWRRSYNGIIPEVVFGSQEEAASTQTLFPSSILATAREDEVVQPRIGQFPLCR